MASMKQELDRQKDEYLTQRDSLNEKERALFERSLWDAAKGIFKGPTPERRNWFRDEFGEPTSTYERRSTVLNLGSWAEPIWDHVIHNNMSLTAAVRLGREAKAKAASTGTSNADALLVVLKDYEGSGYETTSATGKRYRRANPKTEAHKPQKNLDGFLDFDVNNTKKFNSAIHAMVSQFVEARLKGVEPSIKNELVTDFYYGLKVLREDLIRELNRLRAEQRRLAESEKPSFRRFKVACGVLGAEATSPKRPPSFQDLRRRYRDKAARFHPDRNNGDDQYVKQYHAVNEAWELIKNYYRKE